MKKIYFLALFLLGAEFVQASDEQPVIAQLVDAAHSVVVTGERVSGQGISVGSQTELQMMEMEAGFDVDARELAEQEAKLQKITHRVPGKCFYDDPRIMALIAVHASKKDGEYAENLDSLIGKLQKETDLSRADQMLSQVTHFEQAVKMHGNFERGRVKDRCVGGIVVLGCEAVLAGLGVITVLATKLVALNETYTP